LKELQVFQDGRADFLKVVNAEKISDRGFNEVPRPGLRWEQVTRAPHSLDGGTSHSQLAISN
jgi:hypothetical protein